MEVSFQTNKAINSLSQANFNNAFNEGNFKFYDFLSFLWEANHIIFFLDTIREQMRSEIGKKFSEKITEEEGQFRMLIPYFGHLLF